MKKSPKLHRILLKKLNNVLNKSDPMFMDRNTPQVDLQIHCNPVSSAALFAGMDKLILKFLWEFIGPRIARTVLKRTK